LSSSQFSYTQAISHRY